MTKLYITKFGQGPNLVLLHGWGSSSKVWQSCISTLSQHYRVWCVDLPGHGDSHNIKWDAEFDQGVELLAASIPQPCSIIAWSLGGLFAQLYTNYFTEHVSRLMLLASTPKFIADDHWPHGMQQTTFNSFQQQYKLAPQETLLKFSNLQVLHTKQRKQTLKILKSALSNQYKHKNNIAWGLDWLSKLDFFDSEKLKTNHIQMLHGELDQVVSIDAAKQTSTLWENSKLLQISDAGHAAFISHENDFINLVHNWMES